MHQNHNLTQKEISQIAKPLFTAIINRLYKEGLIMQEELSDRKRVYEIVKKFLDKNKDTNFIELVTDHRDNLIKSAEFEISNGNFGLAISLYATFIEHTLNKIIHLACEEKGIAPKTQTEIIRSVNINAKCTWLFTLLGLKPLKKEHLKTIISISDERNSYLHYKWKPDIDMDKVPNLEKEKIDRAEKFKKAKLLCKYLRNIEAKLEFNGKKGCVVSV